MLNARKASPGNQILLNVLARALIGVLALIISFCGCDRTRSTNSGVEHFDKSSGGNQSTVVTVDLRVANLQLFWKKPDGSRFDNVPALSEFLQQTHQQKDFATNAGIFEPSMQPLGLHVAAGIALVPLNLGDGGGNFYLKPNGVFLIADIGARIVESNEYSKLALRPRLATQSGPLLLVGGTINPAFATDSKNRRIRSGVGVVDAHTVVFILSRARVTFHEFAEMFQSMGCTDALYLDGEISRFHFAGEGNDDKDEHFAGILAVVSSTK
jgi:uncharacterized protein YigE (DUF2233 family)